MDSDKENSVDLNGSFSSSDLSPLTRLAVNRRPGRSSRSRQTVLPSKLKDQNVLLDSVLDTSRKCMIFVLISVCMTLVIVFTLIMQALLVLDAHKIIGNLLLASSTFPKKMERYRRMI